MTKIKESRLLITGGASGIGRIMGRQALQRGAKEIVVWDINEQNIASTIDELSAYGRVKGYKVDVSSSECVEESYAQVKRECGDVDIVINCAGVVTSNKTFDKQTVDALKAATGVTYTFGTLIAPTQNLNHAAVATQYDKMAALDAMGGKRYTLVPYAQDFLSVDGNDVTGKTITVRLSNGDVYTVEADSGNVTKK